MSQLTRQVNTSTIFPKRAFFGPMLSKIRDQVLDFVREDEVKILDIGCGNGLLFVQMLLGRKSKLSCLGIDLSFENLQEAEEVFKSNHINDCQLIQGDGLGLPFQPGQFDQVFCLNTIYNLPSISKAERLIDQMTQMCAPNGSIVFDMRNAHNPLVWLKCWLHNRKGGFQTNAYKYWEIAEMLDRKGFMVARKLPIGPPTRWLAYAYLIEAKRKT